MGATDVGVRSARWHDGSFDFIADERLARVQPKSIGIIGITNPDGTSARVGAACSLWDVQREAALAPHASLT